MKKYLLLILLCSIASFASQYVTLDNGKTVLLKDDGTYEQITLIEKNGKTIALKKDGTWESVPQKSIVAGKVVGEKNKELYELGNSHLARALIGCWKSSDGSLAYNFEKDGKLLVRKGNRWEETTYKVEDIDESMRNIVVNVGEEQRLGFLSFGGEHWSLHLDEDNKTLHNDTLKLRTFKDIPLIRKQCR